MLVLMLLVASLLAASPSLHQYLHEDSAPGNELCVVCLLAHGQLDHPAPAALLSFLVFSLVILTLSARTFPFACIDRRLSPTRGPPALFLLPIV